MHSLDIFRVVGVAEQAPFGERDGLPVGGGEIRLLAQPIRLVDELPELFSRGLVVAVGADDVHDVVARIALRPGNRVPAARRREIEAETRAGNRAHRGHDAPPVRAPGVRVRGATPAVGLPVHFPAENDDRVAGAHRHQMGREVVEVEVVSARRAAAQQRGQHRSGQPGLVRDDHRHVDHQQPARVGPPPGGPRHEQLRRALDAVPVVAGQIGVPDGHRGAEPFLESADLFHALRPGAQKCPQGNIIRRLTHRLGLEPGHQSGDRQRYQRRRDRQNGRERTEGNPPFTSLPEWPPGWMDIRSSHAYRMPSGVRREQIGQPADAKIYLATRKATVRHHPLDSVR